MISLEGIKKNKNVRIFPIYKAISSKLPKNTDDIWTKIEIQNNTSGKPIANIDSLKLKNIQSMDLSLSHIKEYAIASFVIIFG